MELYRITIELIYKQNVDEEITPLIPVNPTYTMEVRDNVDPYSAAINLLRKIEKHQIENSGLIGTILLNLEHVKTKDLEEQIAQK